MMSSSNSIKNTSFINKNSFNTRINKATKTESILNNSLDVNIQSLDNLPDVSKKGNNRLNKEKKVNGSDKSKKLVSTLSIINYPSISEMYYVIDKFLETNKYPKHYISENKNKELYIKFETSSIGFEFIKYMNKLKANSNLYSRIQTSLYFGKENVVDSKYRALAKNEQFYFGKGDELSLINNKYNENENKKGISIKSSLNYEDNGAVSKPLFLSEIKNDYTGKIDKVDKLSNHSFKKIENKFSKKINSTKNIQTNEFNQNSQKIDKILDSNDLNNNNINKDKEKTKKEHKAKYTNDITISNDKFNPYDLSRNLLKESNSKKSITSKSNNKNDNYENNKNYNKISHTKGNKNNSGSLPNLKRSNTKIEKNFDLVNNYPKDPKTFHKKDLENMLERKKVYIYGIYKTEEEIKREENNEIKKRWIDKKGFVSIVKKGNDSTFIPNFVNCDKWTGSPLNHKFRDENKSKWMNKDFFLS